MAEDDQGGIDGFDAREVAALDEEFRARVAAAKTAAQTRKPDSGLPRNVVALITRAVDIPEGKAILGLTALANSLDLTDGTHAGPLAKRAVDAGKILKPWFDDLRRLAAAVGDVRDECWVSWGPMRAFRIPAAQLEADLIAATAALERLYRSIQGVLDLYLAAPVRRKSGRQRDEIGQAVAILARLEAKDSSTPTRTAADAAGVTKGALKKRLARRRGR